MKSKVVTTFIKAFEIYGRNEADSKGLIKGLLEK
jgi:hypothetical protein